MKSRTLVVVVVVVVASVVGGCVAVDPQRPKPGAAASGEPLLVVDRVQTWTTTTKEKVGEGVVKDVDGNTIGTVDEYEERRHLHSQNVWYGYQGQQLLADEDFFRIAGDVQAVEATERAHRAALARNRGGNVAMVVGCVALVVGVTLELADSNDPTMLAIGLTSGIAGTVALLGGWYLARSGAEMMEPDRHAVDRAQAERDAIQYNRRAGTVGLSVGRTF